MTHKNSIAIDFETYLIEQEAGQFPRPVCLSYYTNNNAALAVGMEEMHRILQWAFNSGRYIIAHNAIFELGVIYTHFPDLQDDVWQAVEDNRIICTQINEQIADHTRKKQHSKYSLAHLVEHYFQEDISESKKDPNAWRLRYSELDGVPKEEWPEEAIQYALDDSIWAYKLACEQEDVSYGLSVKAALALNLMGNFGMLVDRERVSQLESELQAYLTPNYQYLIEKGYCTPTKGKPRKNLKGLQEYIPTIVASPEYTAKGNVSTSGESLAKYYAESGDEVLEKFINIAEYEKAITAYINRLNKQELIRTAYSTTKSTGRTSSSSSVFYASVNIQQMPRELKGVTWDIRNCFIPREGKEICSIDYSGLELSSAAHQLFVTYGRSKMQQLINRGDTPVDMHSMTAARLMSLSSESPISYEAFLQHKKEKAYAYWRQLTKPINLGFPGGIGYDTMRHLLYLSGIVVKYQVLVECPSEEKAIKVLRLAKYRFRQHADCMRVGRTGKYKWAVVYDELVKFKAELFKLYPELGQFLKQTHEQFLTGETKNMKNEYGEWEQEPMYSYTLGEEFKRDWTTYTAFCNGYLMQSPAALGAKNAVYQVVKKYFNNPALNPLAFIHDEIVFEVDKNRLDLVEDVATIMIDEMQKVLYSVRIAVEAELMPYWKKAGGTWGATYFKNIGDKHVNTV